MNRLSYISTALVFIFSATFWWQGTSGLQAFTSETARRLEVLESPKTLSNLNFENQNNEPINFVDYQGKVVLVDFIYTRCPDICHALGFAFKSIKEDLKELGLDDQVQIANISFDLENDMSEELDAYIKRYSNDTSSWHGLRLKDPQKLPQLLNDFGIVVIANDRGGFDHNAAIHLLDEKGRLIGIYDYQAQKQIVKHIREQIETITL